MDEVELGDARSVPERHVAPLAVRRDDGGIGKSARDALEGGKIKSIKDFAGFGIDQERFVRLIASNEEAFFPGDFADAQSCGIGDILEFVAAELAWRNRRPRSERQELFWGDFAVVEGINGYTVAHSAFLVAEGIRVGGDGGVKMFAVQAESEPKEVSLVDVAVQPFVRNVSYRVSLYVQHSKRLIDVFVGRVVGPKAAVQENDESAIRGNGRRRRKIVDGAGMAGNFAEQAAIRELGGGLGLSLPSRE